MCVIKLSVSARDVFIFSLYMTCDSNDASNVADYNEVLSTVSNVCTDNDVQTALINCWRPEY